MNPHVDKMYRADKFSQWLGIKIIEDGPGICIVEMKVREEMVNGFGIAHGGIAYSLADSALAFASNAHGRQAVSIHTSVEHILPLRTDDIIRAIASEDSLRKTLGLYTIRIMRNEELVGLFKGMVFRKE